jgi:hypothetical protein
MSEGAKLLLNLPWVSQGQASALLSFLSHAGQPRGLEQAVNDLG